jgi:hypothetical protein
MLYIDEMSVQVTRVDIGAQAGGYRQWSIQPSWSISYGWDQINDA